jgi:hypothetical protein
MSKPYIKRTSYTFEIDDVFFETDWVQGGEFEAVEYRKGHEDTEVRFVATRDDLGKWSLDEEGLEVIERYSRTDAATIVAFLNEHGGPE